MDSRLLEHLRNRVIVVDGAMGTNLLAHNLSVEDDYRGHENCSEILNETRPEIVEAIHESFLDVGVDCIETNTFGANSIVLGEFGLAEQVYDLNRKGAELARRCADRHATVEHPRWVLGSIGPGTKLPSLGHITFDVLQDDYCEQARGLLDGGVDALLIETCQDILQAKAAISGATIAMQHCSHEVPIIVQITIETSGTMLVGSDVGAALTAIEAYPQVHVIGINCATGPQEMSEHVQFLSRHCTRLLSVLPNAGLPEVVDGEARYPLTPEEFAKYHREFVLADGVNMIGGCCGTTPEHLAEVVKTVRNLRPKTRHPRRSPSVSSLYQSTTLKQDNSFLIIGERTNCNGSRKFKRLLLKEDLDGMVDVAREQVREGSHVLDVCVDYVGRDGVRDMEAVVGRFTQDVSVPLMLDSTEAAVIEAGLKKAGGKCIVNSVNLEDGEGKLEAICPLLQRYGAAVVALTIDEDPDEAMAKVVDRKVAIAERLHGLLTEKHNIPETDILFDCLTFPITTGIDADRRLAIETLDAIEQLAKEFPKCGYVLGVSNVSFGLAPASRAVLNSVFLHEALHRGLTAAIVHASKLLPRDKISDERWNAALDLIYDRKYDRKRENFDPLQHFIGLFEEGEKITKRKIAADLPVEERLKQRIVDGSRAGIEGDLDTAMEKYTPLEIINDFLLDGMRIVGDQFGAGRMQLPFVLSSAETMKAAVGHLQPFMKQSESQSRGSIVLATVKGDVHDIGKNLVDIILTNNGYTVHNLGIKQSANSIIEAYEEHQADAIGMSGLLVKSTLVMRDNLQVLNERGIRVPVILGGAALTRGFVEHELRDLYGGEVAYARDAFDGLSLMKQIAEKQPIAIAPRQKVSTVARTTRRPRPTDLPQRSDIATDNPVPEPPFWGTRVIEDTDLDSLIPYINETMLFQVQWQYRKQRRSPAEYEAFLRKEVRPAYKRLLRQCADEGTLRPKAVYGYWPCNSEGDDLVIYEPPAPGEAPSRIELLRFTFPRQDHSPFWSLSDFWRPYESGELDVVAFQIVTMGPEATRVALEHFYADRYRDYLHLHGLGVEMAEALTEFIHKRIRTELAIAGDDAKDMKRLFKQGYQGSRYSFGYPACPDLEDQAELCLMLEPGRIGISLSEEYQLEPEQSTSAIVAHHPQARYFNVHPNDVTLPDLAIRIGEPVTAGGGGLL